MDANVTINKPFRSPLKTTSDGLAQANALHSTTTPVRKSTLSTSHVLHGPPISRHTSTDPAAVAAEAKLRTLQSQIRRIKEDIDVLQQATDILSPTPSHKPDNEESTAEPPASDGIADGQTQGKRKGLAEMITKWRGISQTAADALFPTVAARVESSGGVKAFYAQHSVSNDNAGTAGPSNGNGSSSWVERDELEAGEAMLEEEAEAAYDANGDLIGEAERSERKRQLESARAKRAKEAQAMEDKMNEDRQAAAHPGEEEDAEFTMDTMLKSLNIKADVIGWDSKQQRWVP